MAKKALIAAECAGGDITDATRKTITAGLAAADEVHVFIMAESPDKAAKSAAGLEGVAKALAFAAKDFPFPTAERFAAQLAICAKQGGYDYVIAPANSFGKDILPRAAALCGAYAITDIIAIEGAGAFMRPAYAGNVIETVQAGQGMAMLTVRPTCFAAAASAANLAEIMTKEAEEDEKTLAMTRFISVSGQETAGPDLSAAKTVISGGRGMAGAEGFDMLRDIAKKIGDCAVGASRAAVDSGYASNDMQVGQTGKVVAPDLYIAVGLSGAAQHLAGMKDSKIIAAINKDENAPIFEVADVGLVADLFDVLPQIRDKI